MPDRATIKFKHFLIFIFKMSRRSIVPNWNKDDEIGNVLSLELYNNLRVINIFEPLPNNVSISNVRRPEQFHMKNGNKNTSIYRKCLGKCPHLHS